jgi:uncharacterized repeat protein (TIGR01451 family)
VTGVAPAQQLTCSPVDLAGGGSEAAHVVSATSFAACATYANTATATVGNSAAPQPASASVDVQCAALTLTKTADAAAVRAGQPIGFTLIAANAGPGTADDVTLTDALPAGGGVRWSLDTDGTTTPDCAVVLDAGAQALTCAFGDLAPGAAVTVHLISATTSASCADYPNTAQLGAANAPAVTATASTTVTSCLGVEAQPPVSKPPVKKPPATSPLAVTGATQLSGELKWALALLLIGGLMLLATRGREQREER